MSNAEDNSSDTEYNSSDAEDSSSDTKDILSNAEDNSSDAKDNSSDTEDNSSDTEDSSSDAEDNSSDTEDSSSDAEDNSSDTEDSSSDAEDNWSRGFSKEQADDIIKSINHDKVVYKLLNFPTHLSYYSESKKEYVYHRNGGKHAEEIMLEKLNKVSGRLPKHIWISRSPCKDCAGLLSKAYKDEDKKTTIHFVKFYIGKGYRKKKIEESPHIKRLMKLEDEGFGLEVWDCIKDFKKQGKIDPALVKEINDKEKCSLTHEELIEAAEATIKEDKNILKNLFPLQQLSRGFKKLSVSGTS